MANLLVTYDPYGRTIGHPRAEEAGLKQAILSLPDGLEGQDICEVARKLAELLLEQVSS